MKRCFSAQGGVQNVGYNLRQSRREVNLASRRLFRQHSLGKEASKVQRLRCRPRQMEKAGSIVCRLEADIRDISRAHGRHVSLATGLSSGDPRRTAEIPEIEKPFAVYRVRDFCRLTPGGSTLSRNLAEAGQGPHQGKPICPIAKRLRPIALARIEVVGLRKGAVSLRKNMASFGCAGACHRQL